MIAALFVDPRGPYFGQPDVDPWDTVNALSFAVDRLRIRKEQQVRR
jgi:hypothetical protein